MISPSAPPLYSRLCSRLTTSPRAAIHQPEPLFGGGGFVHLEARGEKLQLDHAAQLVFVFDNQDSLFHAEACGRPSVAARSIGRRTRKMLPLPGSLSTAILPPCSSTILATIASPRPLPPPERAVHVGGGLHLIRNVPEDGRSLERGGLHFGQELFRDGF